ncbi:MAG: chemotaxis protein CheB [Sphingomonas bacterium]|nr:chemotaxis protein CheB [Sphingomonas bacterium]
MNAEPKIIVIGASVGGVEALRALVAALPADLSAAVFIVLHVGSHKSELPFLLNRLDGLPTRHAEDGDPIDSGQIYIAPPDHHMVIQKGRISLTKGPRENWARPAIDPLFRSAAEVYGANVIGVILTGALNDGTAGLYQVAQAGGTTIVQDPADAINPSMPRSALSHVAVDHCLPLAGIAPLLIELVAEQSAEPARANGVSNKRPQEKDEEEEMAAEFTQNIPVAVTCPDCGGALRRRELGSLTQFACHIGHIYTAEVMMAAQFVALERSIELAMRSLGERAELCRQMADKTCHDHGGPTWGEAEGEAHEQAHSLSEMLNREWIHPDGIGVIDNMVP